MVKSWRVGMVRLMWAVRCATTPDRPKMRPNAQLPLSGGVGFPLLRVRPELRVYLSTVEGGSYLYTPSQLLLLGSN